MSRPTAITGPLAACIDYLGGVRAFADEIGVSAQTIWRWGTGRGVPGVFAARAVNGWARRRGLVEPFASCAKAGGAT